MVSISPLSGSGTPTTFTIVVQDPNGAVDLNIVNLLVNSALDGAHSGLHSSLQYDCAGE